MASLVNFLHFAGLTLAVGAVTLRYFVLTRSGLALSERTPSLRDAAKYGFAGGAAVLLAAPLRALVQMLALRMPGDDWLPLLRMVAGSELGRTLMLQGVWALAMMGTFAVARLGAQRGWSGAFITTLISAVVVSMSGHAAAADAPRFAQAMVVVHLLGAGAWIGTLFQLWRIARKASEATLTAILKAFHGVALTGAALLALSGATHVWTILDRPSQLWTTLWGALLAAKLAALAGVLVLGYRHWKRAEAQVGIGERSALRTSMAKELWLAALVLAITGALTSTGLD